MESRLLLSATLVSSIPAQSVTSGQSATVSLGTYFNDPTVPGTAVLMQTPLGNIPIALATSTPMTDANFLHYISSGEYANTIVHRSVPGFVIQGGGYTPDGNHITQFAPVQSEAGISNTVGTIAMALSTGPNSGTSEWFINLGNNSSTLDGTADGGPFTVFGNVIYNGMSVVNQIAAEQVIDDSITNGAWNTAPVVNYTGANPATSPLASSNLVTNNTIVAPALSYSVMVDNPAVLTAGVSNGALTLTPAAGIGATTAHVTVTATDLGGGTQSTSFAVNIGSGNSTGPTPITIGTGIAKGVTYTDADGTTATISLKGPGSATVDFNGSNLVPTTTKSGIALSGTGASIGSISTTGTTGASMLIVTTKGGTKAITVGAITTGDLKAIMGKGVTLGGGLTATGSIGQIMVAGATGNTISATAIGNFTATGGVSSDFTLSGTGTSLAKFAAGNITGGTWTISGNIKSITAGGISVWVPTVAGSIGSLIVNKGDLANGSITAAALGSVKVKGSVNAVQVDLTGSGNDLPNLSAGGIITDSNIITTGSIGNVSATALNASSINAGINPGSNVLVVPSSSSIFSTPEAIGSVKLKANTTNAFSASVIAATDLGRLSLGTVNTANGGTPTGVAAKTIKALNTIVGGKHVNLKNVTTQTQVTTAYSAVVTGDFAVDVVTG